MENNPPPTTIDSPVPEMAPVGSKFLTLAIGEAIVIVALVLIGLSGYYFMSQKITPPSTCAPTAVTNSTNPTSQGTAYQNPFDTTQPSTSDYQNPFATQ